MKNLYSKYILALLMGLGVTMNASAQDITCADLIWSSEAYDAYAHIDQACLEIVQRNGSPYARLSARVINQSVSNTYVRYTHADGSQGPSKQVVDVDFITEIDGEPVAIKNLNVRQVLNVYVGGDLWSVPQPEPELVAAPPPPPPEPEPAPEPAPVVLPVTAGMLPWLALFGSLFLMLGGALRLAGMKNHRGSRSPG